MNKKHSILLVLLYISLNVFSQDAEQDVETVTVYTTDQVDKTDKTLFGSEKISLRGYFALNNKVLTVNKKAGLLLGAELDMVFSHNFNLGFFGYGMYSDVINNNIVPGEKLYYEVGYGGIKIEPVVLTHSAVHFTLPVSFGAGGLSLNKYRAWDSNIYGNNWENDLYDYDAFIFIEPSIGIEFNLYKHMRINGSMGYMFTDNINISGSLLQPLDGWTGNISLRFGWF